MQTGLKELARIGHRFIKIALGEKNMCPFNGELSIESINVDEDAGVVYYHVKFASGKEKVGTKSIDEAVDLGWISERIKE